MKTFQKVESPELKSSRESRVEKSRACFWTPRLLNSSTSLTLALLLTLNFGLSTVLFGQAKTTVTDTIYNADGSKPSGTLVATNLSTFTSADNFVIAAGSKVTATITNGLFSIQLVPNAGSNPSGTSYAVNYYLPGLSMTETWVVPSSVPPVNLAAVRVLSPPLPTVMLGMGQINPPSPCTANFFAQWSGIQWQCAAGGGGGGATFQVNGTNTASQTTINWQTGTNITVSNPSAGNVAFNFSGTLPIASGGTGQTAASAAFNALSPLTTLGDLIYGGSSPAGSGTRLVGNTTTTKQYLTQTGTGAASSAPTWAQGAFADLSGTASDAQLANPYSGVGSCAANQWANALTRNAAPTCAQPGFSNLSGSIALGQTPLTTRGDLLTANATPALIRLGLGTNGQCLTSNGSDALWGACAAGSGVTLQTNTVNNASQTTLNLLNSAATNGFTLTHTNTSGGNVQLGLSGTLTVPGGGTGLGTLTAHNLYVGNATGNPNPVATGNSGQVLISNGGSSDPTFQDPIVSYAYVNLLNAAPATSTQTSSLVRVPTFSGFGTLYVTYASITGSPAGCTLQLKNADSLGNLINNGGAASTTPANGTTTTFTLPSTNLQMMAQMQEVYACTTYPTAGTISLDYAPGLGVGLLTGNNTIGGVTQAGTWTVQPGNTANTTPWLINVGQFGGTNVVTGTGAGGAGIPRVTVSNDSNVLATESGTWTVQPGNTANTTGWLVTGTGGTFPATESGTWTVQPGNTQNTTAWLTQDAANGTVAAGAAAGKAELVGCQFNTTLPTLTNTQQAAVQCDSKGQPLLDLNAWFGSTAPTVGQKTGANSIPIVPASDVNAPVNLAQVGGTNTATGGVAGSQGFGGLQADGAALSGNPITFAGKGSGNARVPVVCDNWTAINQASTTAVTLITGVASKQTYICSINIVVAGANNVALVEGTAAGCATGTAGMAGGATAATGWNFAANGGLTQGTGVGAPFRTATAADNVCVLQSAATQVSGNVTWAQF